MDNEHQNQLTPSDLEESVDSITHARESIANELKKNDEGLNKKRWFDCFSTVATHTGGFFELAATRKQIIGKDLENANLKNQTLLARMKEIRDEHGEGKGPIQVSPEVQEELLQMLDIYKKD